MPSTTNFGWTTPADTDLVKDGASAIRTLGNGIDTSFVDLKGGTTGQVLAKNSNTDLDFVWTAATSGDITGVTAGVGITGGGTSGDVTITNAMADAITTKGDLLAGTAADSFARLGVGTNGQLLAANSATATGLEWQTVASGAYTLLASGSLSGSNLDLTSISGSYTDLRLVITNYNLSSRGNIQMTFNADTGSNYNAVGVANYQGIAASVVWNGFGGNYIWVNQNQNCATTANARNVTVIDIPNYTNTDAYKVCSERYYVNDNTGGTSQAIGNTSGYWAGTAAISRITLDPEGTRTWSGGNYYLYGVK